jgi:hypothetical protein
MHLLPTQALTTGNFQQASHGMAMQASYHTPQTVYVQSVPQGMPMYAGGHMGMPLGPMSSYGMPMQYLQQHPGLASAPPQHQHQTELARSSQAKKQRAKQKKAARRSREKAALAIQDKPAVSGGLQASSKAYDVGGGGGGDAAPPTYRSLQGSSSWLQRD